MMVCAFVLAMAASLVSPHPVLAQAQDDTGIKRAFLDRYLDCAEAPDDASRLACYDTLLMDIPAWLEDPNDPAPRQGHTQVQCVPGDSGIRVDCLKDIKTE